MLIDTVSKGPWFSAKLPAADYRVTATYSNHSYVRHITLTDRFRVYILNWSV